MAETNSQVAKSKSHCIEKSEAKDKNQAEFHERGKVKEEGRKVDKPLAILSNHIAETTLTKGKDVEAMQWEKTTGEGVKENLEGKFSNTNGLGEGGGGSSGPGLGQGEHKPISNDI